VEAVARPQLPANTKIFDPHFETISGIGGLGLFTSPKHIETANSLFAEFNAEEKALKEEKNALLKMLPAEIDWGFYEQNVEDDSLVEEAKGMYESFFNFESLPAVKVAQDEADSDEGITVDAAFEAAVNQRIATLEDTIENDINPLLNPFSDFWTYEMDGPEFAEVFEARPEWNEIINQASDEHAFYFPKEDPVLSTDLQAKYQEEIANVFAAFKPETQQFDLINQIATGRISQQLLDQYTVHYLQPTEHAALTEYTHDDNAAYALRTAYVSQEVDPAGHHFGGH